MEIGFVVTPCHNKNFHNKIDTYRCKKFSTIWY